MAASALTIGSIFRTRELSMTSRITTDPIAENVQCTGDGDCCSEDVTKNNPISPLFLDRKCVTLTSSEDDGVKSHDLRNLVSDISEEECDSTAAPLDFRVDWSTSNTEKMNDWLVTAPIVLINPEVRRDEMAVNDKLSMNWELESILSCEDSSNMEDFEPIDDLLGDTPTSCRKSQYTETQSDLDCRWVEPEYPEVWRISP